MTNKKPLTELNALPAGEFTVLLGGIFEHSPWVAEEVEKARPFSSMDELHAAMIQAVKNSTPERRLALFLAHPDLAGRLTRQRHLTQESSREQAAAGLDEAEPGVVQRIGELNIAYRAKFEFPFIICARLNNVDTILSAMEARLSNTRDDEIATALGEIYKIGKLRLNDQVEN